MDDSTTTGSTTTSTEAPRRGRGRVIAIVGGVVAVATIAIGAVGWALWPGEAEPTPTTTATRTAQAAAPSTPSSTPTVATATGSPTPRPATAPPADPAVPAPFVTPVAAGTVVSEGDVRSPKGSVAYHWRATANGDDTFSMEYSGFTSTLPVPVGATLIEIAPSVGDGLTAHGPGDLQLGGPTTEPALATSTLLGTSTPGYLGTLVTYSAATDGADLPVEIGPEKVLAVTPVTWSVPGRQTNIVVADSGSADLATGTVVSSTAAGGPRGYLVAAGDTIDAVAARFGITPAALIYLNAGLLVTGDQQYLIYGNTINLDPDSV
ncbi:LysM repeat protein [Frigoribacterium sp. PvP120]|uniref:LysM peptidoglycan-binding domain-containing protein n=1 Tax=unclassified Frigoribacterium TaxID=2627005 RepID=UPI001AEA3424|nr:LysM peptidoglycan-binding domain-containing protein [Frigoribacterium sp. PvP121]MBP1240945.1 LysM repeat protein [Frigoribacterium sp. PvP121]